MNLPVASLMAFCVTVAALVPVPVSAQSPSEPIRMSVSRQDCQRLVRHRPDPGVAYEPGVDVRGRRVVPADADNRAPIELPDIFTFAITRELAGLPGDTGAEMSVGTVTYDPGSGRFAFNGRPLSDPALTRLSVKCRAAIGGEP